MNSYLPWLLLGWLMSLGLGITVARRSNGKLGFSLFLAGFAAVLWLLPAASDETIPATTRPTRPAQRIAVVDFRQLMQSHPKAKRLAIEQKARSAEAEIEVRRLTAQGATKAADQMSRSLRGKLANEQRETRDEVVRELRQLIAKIAFELKVDAVFDASSLSHVGVEVILLRSGWADLTDAVMGELPD